MQIDGEKRTFSNVENISNEENNVKASKEDKIYEVAQKPTEGKWFEVKPLGIDQTIFKKKREDARQEKTRHLILEAFEEMKNNPEKYGKNFKTMMPKKTWVRSTARELKKLACDLGDHMANWVEQSLEWAQRIANGESWEDICNKRDSANWYRAVIWKKNGRTRIVGGSVQNFNHAPASLVISHSYDDNGVIIDTVPLVIDYDEEASVA